MSIVAYALSQNLKLCWVRTCGLVAARAGTGLWRGWESITQLALYCKLVYFSLGPSLACDHSMLFLCALARMRLHACCALTSGLTRMQAI
eukprot:6188052-Pleurochrysis_carterae.AAC.2